MNAIDQQRPPEAPDAAGIYRIWPGEGRAPGSEHWTHRESTMQIPWTTTNRRLTRNVVIPTITAFLPEPGKANGTAMVVAPGGAFHFLMIDHEGYDMARWLAGLGVAAFVLKYRLAQTPDADADLLDFRNELQRRLHQPGPMGAAPPANPAIAEARLWAEEDGRQAIRYVRQHAADWGIDPQRIGIGGFSAGGAATMGPVFEHDAASRPDFAVGIYPAYRAGLPLPADAPPLFLTISDDDKSVAPLSSARLYEAWHTAGIPAEIHIFGNGAHGFGFGKSGLLSDPWADLLQNWLAVRGLLPKPE
jgi:acetyl esterase/lipase